VLLIALIISFARFLQQVKKIIARLYFIYMVHVFTVFAKNHQYNIEKYLTLLSENVKHIIIYQECGRKLLSIIIVISLGVD
jgi:hypothetical protein